jgi:PAS domain-containing protein
MKNKNVTNAIKLRKAAEESLENHKPTFDLNLAEFNVLKLVHELQVHQIELEMQNEEITRAKEMTEVIAEKYLELFNLAPLGYFIVSDQGEIVDLNNFGSLMFNVLHVVLKKSNFIFFVIDEDKHIFNLFLENLFRNRGSETCMISISLDQNITKHVLLTGNISKKSEYCLIAAIDISERLELEKESTELKLFNDYFIGRELRMVELKKEVNELLHKGGFENKYPV